MLLLLAAGCGGRSGEAIGVVAETEREERAETTSEAWDWVDSVMSEMSVEEKIGQLYMPAMYARSDAASLSRLQDYVVRRHIGGIVLLKGDVRSAAVIADTLRALRGRGGVFLAIDAENGLRMRLTDAPEFPWGREMGKISDDQLLYDFGREIARECRAVGISMVLGPVMDVVPGEDWHGIMRKRSMGSNPRRVADLAIAYARGLEEGNVISVAKHFPGHGSALEDSHRRLGTVAGDAARLDSTDLYPFRRYSEELLSGVMVGHLAASALDSIRRPAVVSPVVIQDILRGELGFSGLVLTDALNMEGALGVTGWQALAAGADIVLAPGDTDREIRETLSAIDRGELNEEIVENRARRVLFFKYLCGLPFAGRIDADRAVEEVKSRAAEMQDTIESLLHNRPSSL